MNNLDALIIVRGCARVSAQMRTRQGISAGKVVDKKIQSLLRKKAWRECRGTMPVHMGDDDFRYAIPDDPFTAALKKIAALPTDQLAPDSQCAAVVIAMDALSVLEINSSP
jgi:hypothetical protein